MRRFCLAVLIASLSGAVLANGPAARIEASLNAYYEAERSGDAARVRESLQAVLALEPDHATAWRALGYHYQGQEQHGAAAEAFLRAADNEPGSEMLMAAGYAFQAANRQSSAAKAFRRATGAARTAEEYSRACLSYAYTAPLQRRRLPEPWGLSFYSDTLYASRFENTVTENRLRLRYYLDEARRASLYGMLTYQDDWKSQVSDGIPEIYSDNYAGLGVGADWRPHPALRLYGEVSRNRDLLDRPDRRRASTDSRVGVDAFAAWGAQRRCSLNHRWPLAAYGQAYGSVQYPSRYDNLLGQATLWQGWRLHGYRMSSLSLYGKVNWLWDSEGLYYNNLVEAGPGLAWRPSIAWPVEVRLERLFGRYLGGDPPQNGYATTQLQVIINFDI